MKRYLKSELSLDNLTENPDCSHVLVQLVTEDADPQKELLYEVVSGLPEEQQELFHMRYFWEMTQQEIADRLGISQNVVSRRLRKLEDLLARKCRDAL